MSQYYPPPSGPPTPPVKHTGRRAVIIVAAILVIMFAVFAACTAAIEGTFKEPTNQPTATPSTKVSRVVPQPNITTMGVPIDNRKIIARDVKLRSCTLGDMGIVRASLTLKNTSALTLSYVLTGEVVNADGDRVGQWSASTTHLAPEQTVRLSGLGSIEVGDDRRAQKVRCRVVELSVF